MFILRTYVVVDWNCIIQTHDTDKVHEYFLWICLQMDTTETCDVNWTLVQVMGCCCQAIYHYLRQSWPRCKSQFNLLDHSVLSVHWVSNFNDYSGNDNTHITIRCPYRSHATEFDNSKLRKVTYRVSIIRSLEQTHHVLRCHTISSFVVQWWDWTMQWHMLHISNQCTYIWSHECDSCWWV